jgi:SAM-dependent methyltransferase
MAKQYDRAYFDRWYRRAGFGSPAVLERKARYAVAVAEYLLGRPLRSVLDVGCGEGAWQPAVRKLRPATRYVGVDPSTYAVHRYGTRRNLRVGGVRDLTQLDLGGPFDLIVCIDVLPYVANDDVRAGLASIARLLRGVALIELFTSVDDFEGDLDDYRSRAPSTYRRWLREAGLERIGPNVFAGAALLGGLAAFERGSPQAGG